MSITDELRERAHGFHVFNEERLLAIADRIDAEHGREMEERADRYSELRAKMNNCYIELPVDADGVPIHVGEELDYLEALHPDVPSRFKVQDMFYFGNGEWRLRAYPATYEPEKCRHYHAPTVEDVLLEACKAYHGLMTESMSDIAHDMPAPSEIIAEYAKRLTLAEGEDV